MRAISIISVLFAFVVATAQAQDDQRPFSYEWYRKDLYWKNYFCGGRYRADGCERHRYRRYYRQPYVHSHCRPRVRVVGWEANSQRGAQTYGERAWFFSVRHDLGAKYANLDRAKDVKFKCDPSTVTQVAKRLLWICVVEAIPCEAAKADNVKEKRNFSDHDVGGE